MLALGLCVDIPSKKRPVVRAVLLDDGGLGVSSSPTLSAVAVVEQFDLTSVEDDWALLCRDYGKNVSARVSTLSPDVVVVRRADRPLKPNNYEGPRQRLMIEGAVTATAFLTGPRAVVVTGKECGTAYGSDKATLDRDATTLVSRSNHVEAAAAGLAGLFGFRT